MQTVAHERLQPQAQPANPGSAWGDIPDHILERLTLEGIGGPDDWRALGRRRFALWGVTRAMVAQLDELARARP